MRKAGHCPALFLLLRVPGRPHSFDLARAASDQLGRLGNARSAGAKRDDAVVHAGVTFAAGVAAGGLRQLDTLTLTLAPILVVVAGHLQGELQKHVLDGFQNDFRHSVRLGGQLRQVHHARHGQLGPFGPDRRNQALGLGQRQAADAVDLLRNDDFTRLQVRDHAQQLGPVGACAGRLLAVDAGDVVPGGPRGRYKALLAFKILLVRTGAQVDAGDLQPSSLRLLLSRRHFHGSTACGSDQRPTRLPRASCSSRSISGSAARPWKR
uniref:Uncharacterized 28.3 kDa protein in PAR locus n=1 Tax=Escherichia coli TaxID=562 RepID=YPR5_ECOLX|nr:RecName: Full=Uncharacterized 28.3 kDa protein in PAR locus; AltName: Full=ORF 5 [Escherichia coli]AAA26413.1 putative [Plasmid RP4]